MTTHSPQNLFPKIAESPGFKKAAPWHHDNPGVPWGSLGGLHLQNAETTQDVDKSCRNLPDAPDVHFSRADVETC